MKTNSFGATDPGKKRRNNEDSYLLEDQPGLYAVADGVGGSEGGEVASRITVELLAEVLPDLLDGKDRTPPSGLPPNMDQRLAALQYAFALSNRKIRQERSLNRTLSEMGTTLTALLLKNGSAFLSHIGDSRAYLLRSGEFTQLTKDHSLVAEQVRAGLCTPEQARKSPYRHVITRALGIEEEATPDLAMHAVQKDDTFLLCTDGLTEMVEDREIRRILAAAAPRDAVRKLVDAANKAGGVDNITAVVVRVTEV